MPRTFSGWCAFSSLSHPAEAVLVRVARIDPIPFRVKNDATGLGKTSQDFRMIETTVSQRRELDSERQRNETEEQRKAREASACPTPTYFIAHYHTTIGRCCSSRCSPVRDIGGPSAVLLHRLRETVPKRRPV